MYANDEKQLVYFEHEEHLVRRLGSALVTSWAKVPVSVRELLIIRAQDIVDDEDPARVATDLQALLLAHQ